MSDSPDHAAAPKAGSGGVRLLAESVLVLLAGLAFALLANHISPRGLKLGQDYFPGAGQPARPPVASQATPQGHPTLNHGSASNALAARLLEQGLRAIGLDQAEQFYKDPQYAQERILFVDARDDANYQAGHVPGAYQFDHYHAGTYLPALLPACQTAQKIVLYCHGGDCEDSEFAAVTLRQAGVPAARLFVYTGGFSEWTNHGLAVELGARSSGDVRASKP